MLREDSSIISLSSHALDPENAYVSPRTQKWTPLPNTDRSSRPGTNDQPGSRECSATEHRPRPDGLANATHGIPTFDGIKAAIKRCKDNVYVIEYLEGRKVFKAYGAEHGDLVFLNSEIAPQTTSCEIVQRQNGEQASMSGKGLCVDSAGWLNLRHGRPVRISDMRRVDVNR